MIDKNFDIYIALFVYTNLISKIRWDRVAPEKSQVLVTSHLVFINQSIGQIKNIRDGILIC